jgi:hypothetical protein
LLLFQDGLTEELLVALAMAIQPQSRLSDHRFIVRMRALKSVFAFDGEGAMAESDTHRPKIKCNEGCFGSRLSSAKFLSAKRWTRTGRGMQGL